MKKIIKDAMVLFIITLVAGVLLGLVYMITKDPIAKQNEKTKIAAYNSVFSGLDRYEELDSLDEAQKAVDAEELDGVTVNEIVKAYDSSDKELGYIITVTDANGYGGDIKMTVGIDSTGTITGLEILDISETAGLGMKAKEASFREQFKGIKADKITYTKNGKSADNEIDAISSATITTNAVTGGVNGALAVYHKLGGAVSE